MYTIMKPVAEYNPKTVCRLIRVLFIGRMFRWED
jgi:hypothetical protein